MMRQALSALVRADRSSGDPNWHLPRTTHVQEHPQQTCWAIIEKCTYALREKIGRESEREREKRRNDVGIVGVHFKGLDFGLENHLIECPFALGIDCNSVVLSC